MTDDSFTYNGIDMYEQFNIRIVKYDLLMPELRPRKVSIPLRSGAYDYGANYHEERPLRLSVAVDGELSVDRFDNLKYILSRKGRIIMWDLQDRYFYGQLYDPVEVIDYFQHCRREFEIVFICEPYAYALEPTTLTSDQRTMPINYEGTRETPTLITIRNLGTTAMQGITITARVAN